MLNIRKEQMDALSDQNQGAPVVQECHQSKWIGLQYKHIDGTGVAGAAYVVKLHDGSILLKGKLDNNGYAFRDDISDEVGGVLFYFHDDPEEYQVTKTPIKNPYTGRVSSFVDSALKSLQDGLEWTGDVLEGDFNRDPETSEIIAGTALTLIPIVDQIGDARDVIANTYYLIDFYEKDDEHANRDDEFWLWVALVLTLIGCIPELGTAIKGVLSVILRSFRKAAGKVNLKAVFRDLMRVLNFVGNGGNAYRWLKQLLSNLDSYGKWVASEIKPKLDFFKRSLDSIPTFLVKKKDEILKAIDKMRSKVDTFVQRVINWFKEKLSEVLPEHTDIKPGATNTINTKQQGALDPHTINQPKKRGWSRKNTSDIPDSGLVKGPVSGAPPVNAGQQGKHVSGHPNHTDPRKSVWGPNVDHVAETQNAWVNGKPVPGQPQTRSYNTGKPIGENGETWIKVHREEGGSIHGVPINRNP